MLRIHNFIEKFRQWRRNEADIKIVTFRPVHNGGRTPEPFTLSGLILDSNKKPRTLGTTGTSRCVTIPEAWVPQLKPPFTLVLLEVDGKAVLIQEHRADESHSQEIKK